MRSRLCRGGRPRSLHQGGLQPAVLCGVPLGTLVAVRFMRCCFAILSGLLACGPGTRRVQAHAPDDVLERDLDGSYVVSSSASTAYLGEPCPPGAVGRGWSRFPVSATWCVDAHGLLQGLAVMKQPDGCRGSTRIGHYRNGIADGAFSGPDGSATYALGLLEGSCHGMLDMLTYHQGRLDGPFTGSFGVRVVDTGPTDSGGCNQYIETIRGTIRGSFANGVAVDKFVISIRREPIARTPTPGVIDLTDERDEAAASWSEREIPIEPGVPVEVAELGNDAKDLSELLGPAHRWVGWPHCAYGNDTVAHRSPLR